MIIYLGKSFRDQSPDKLQIQVEFSTYSELKSTSSLWSSPKSVVKSHKIGSLSITGFCGIKAPLGSTTHVELLYTSPTLEPRKLPKARD
jgi:hypothetical protein